MTISDAVHSEGRAGFYFLPPMVPDPAVDGAFDATFEPTVEICAWDGAACALPLLAEFTTATGPGSETVRAVPEDERYIVNWHTDEFGLSPDLTYRIRVLVAGTVMGFADVDVVSGGNELKNVDTGEYIALKDGRTLPIAFRIETGAVFVVGEDGGTVTTSDGAVTLSLPPGALSAGMELGITVEAVADSELPDGLDLVPGAVFEFGPDGTEFSELVELSIKYDEARLPAGVAEAALVVVDEVSPGVWMAAPSQVDVERNVVTGLVSGFSGKALGGAVSAGGNHTCTLRPDGTYCWGYNAFGQLGDGSTVDRRSPTRVDSSADFVKVAVGSYHSCGLDAGGAAYCWGAGAYGQLGVDPVGAQTVPVLVRGGVHFTSISVGEYWTCGISLAGTAYCWGYNPGGLGDGATKRSAIPVAVAAGNAFVRIDVGPFHACGTTEEGWVSCWGINVFGQLGNGTANTPPEVLPTPVSGSIQFAQLSLGWNHTCGLDLGGLLYCWGYNALGQLGDGTLVDSPDPVRVVGLDSTTTLSLGYSHSCAVSSDGTAACWGFNDYGQLGDGSTQSAFVPVVVSGGHEFGSISAGGWHTCGTVAGGEIYCWGNGAVGQIGNGTSGTAIQPLPTLVQGLPTPGIDPLPLQRLSAGQTHACALEPGGKTRCWGSDDRGQLGNGPGDSSGAAGVHVSGGHDFSSLASGRMHTCALTEAGEPYCWGDNRWGQLGDATVLLRHEPVAVAGGLTLRSLTAALGTTCGVSTSDLAYCWGVGGSGQRGDGTKNSASSPTPLAGDLRFASVAVGDSHGCGITTAGDAYCWGRNDAGQVGDGTTTERLVPTKVQTSVKFTSWVAVGTIHSCALSQDSGLYCWGGNSAGQLGKGSADAGMASPVQVSSSGSFETVTAGGGHNCSLDASGDAQCWGFGLHGQLGYGATGNRAIPVAVSGGHTFLELEAGTNFTCGLTASDVVYCWGENGETQLRDGTTLDRATPVTWMDADGDGFADPVDNCPFTASSDQLDTDADGLGNACDHDQIAFHSSRDGDDEIYLMNADGTGVFNITNSPGLDFGPIWSPDRRSIAYRSDRAGNCDIRVVDVYTLVDVALTSSGACEQNPRWSPDGSRIAYQAGTGTSAQVWIMNSDGTGKTQISGGSFNFEPEWSPDGTRLVFQSRRSGTTQIYSINADGTGETDLSANTANDRAPDWSPDGTKIVFDSDRSGAQGIWVMNADGSGQALLHGPVGNGAIWSPDGTRIAFAAGDLYVMDSDGSNVTNLAPVAGQDRHPAWRWDGSAIVFDSQQDGGPPEVYSVSSDGTGLTRLTDAAGSNQFPQWQLGR